MTATPEEIAANQPLDKPNNGPAHLPDDPTMAPPDEMTEEDARLLADTMPGEGPGGD